MCIPVIWAFAHKGIHFRLLSSCYPFMILFNHKIVSSSLSPPPPLPAVHQPPLPSTISRSLLKFMSVMFSNHFILCHPVLLCLQSFPGSGSFPMSCLLASGGQSFGPSALASVLWMNIQGWLLLGLTGLISSWL